MHKPTQQPETCTVESPSAQSTSISREKHTLDSNSVRFGRSNRKVPATYFPLFEIEPTKTPRKTASRVHRVESTCISKKIRQWKVQTAQKTRPNSPLGHARLESAPSNHRDPVNRFCATEAWSMLRLRKQLNHQGHHEYKESKPYNASSLCPLCPRGLPGFGARFRHGQDQVRHPLASSCPEHSRRIASFCSKLRQRVTLRAQQPARHSCFLLLVAIFGQKKCARGCQGNRKSTESTFGSRFSTGSIFPRVVQNTFGSERFHFRVEKVFSHANNDFEQSHLTPMITSRISPENQISRQASIATSTPPLSDRHPFGHWDLVIGHSQSTGTAGCPNATRNSAVMILYPGAKPTVLVGVIIGVSPLLGRKPV
jgi:hypothetical protein